MEGATVFAKSEGYQAIGKVVIKDFVELMSVCKPGKSYSSDTFMVGDTPMVAKVFPNGLEEEHKGFVSIYLSNRGDAAITVKCKFTTDVRSKKDRGTIPIEPNRMRGFGSFLKHDECVNEYQDKDFVLTVQVESPGSDWEVLEQKSSEDPEEFNVWDNVFTNMERTDFTLVFDGHEIPCHKHILAASSPVLRAMVENHHVEAVQSKAEVGQAFLRFIYTGKLDESLLKEHAPSFLELGEMYDLRELKDMAEGELMKRLDKKTMVTLLSRTTGVINSVCLREVA